MSEKTAFMRHNETELKMKNKILIVILVLLMISPTVAAIINYNLQQSGSADSHNTVKVTVTDPDGAAYEFTRENGEDMIPLPMPKKSAFCPLPLKWAASTAWCLPPR